MPGVIEAQRAYSLVRQYDADVGDYVQDLRWSPDGRFLAAASISGPLAIIHLARDYARIDLAGHTVGTTSIDWHPAAALLASGGQDGRVRVWNLDRNHGQEVWSGNPAWVERVAWSPSGRYLAWTAGKSIAMRDQENDKILDGFQPHESTVADIAWAPGKDLLASTAYGGVRLWKPACPLPSREFYWKGSSLTLRWSPDHRFIATGDQDATVHFWFTESGQDLRMWGFPGKVKLLAWSHTSRHLATASGACIAVWDCHGKNGPEGRKPVLPECSSPSAVTALDYQRHGPLLTAGYQDGNLAIWNHNQTTDALFATRHPGDAIVQAVWSPDNGQLAIGTESGRIFIYALIKRKES